MNIFVLEDDPIKSAQSQCDKHVVKMILETAQMLCTVAHRQGFDAPYRATHGKHPCTVWTGESKENWDWLIKHGMALCEEYTERYGKIHKTQQHIEWCKSLSIGLPSKGLSPFAQAMPTQYRNKCAIQAYRAYYKGEKSGFATWKRNKPKWWIN
tara:strand:+ start:1355 stop:1816 length:462 start_codon:yes stop_codon:yes gene_type:complete